MMYINIHTHYPSIHSDVLFIKNIIAGKDKIPEQAYYSIGIHPWYGDKSLLESIRKNITNTRCLAIGECGLDLMPPHLKQNPLAQQISLFIEQVKIAEKYHKPVIIHCVKCYDKILQLKKQFRPKQGWIIHGYSKNEILAGQLIKAGFYLSFGALLFESTPNQKALQNTPLDKIFLETDDQQKYSIKAIYRQAARVLNLPEADLQQQIEANFRKIFR